MAGSGTAHLREPGSTILSVEDLVVEFPVGTTGLKVHAVSGVSFDLLAGETLGLVGESGCGKSTTGRAVLQMFRPNSGHVRFEGTDMVTAKGDDLRNVRKKLQMIFQDPISSLNPRRPVREIVREPLTIAWLESFPASPIARLWEAFVKKIVKLWPFLWKWARWGLIAVGIGTLLWVIGARAEASPAPGEPLEGLAKTLSGLTGTAKIFLIPGFIYLAPFAAIFLVTAAIWILLVALLPIVGLPRRFAMRRSRTAFLASSEAKVREVLNIVGLDPDVTMDKYPHQFSGGQCQRISIARALALEPKLLICDEPVSALDVSIQAQVLNLLEDLKAKYGLTMVFISHDLSVVKNISDRVAVMYLGKVCEVAPADDLYRAPTHPYTVALLDAIPVPDPAVSRRDHESLVGDLPSPIAPPSGCRFRTRCAYAQARCAEEEPQIREVRSGHYVACHFPLVGQDALPDASDRRPVAV